MRRANLALGLSLLLLATGCKSNGSWSGLKEGSADATADGSGQGSGSGEGSGSGSGEASGEDCSFGACSWARPCEGSDCPTLTDLRQVVPGPGLPAEIVDQPANNNLDVARFNGRTYLAFRTAPSHFASPEAMLYVMSSEDETNWRFEGSFSYDRDVREPRFLAWNGRLWFYFATLGTSAADFVPGDMYVTEYLAPGSWTEPQTFYGAGFIPWRARVINDLPYLVTYKGGENIYDASGEPLEVHLLTTDDGVNWRPVVEGKPAVRVGGDSETDFALLPDGSLVAVTRNEAGDETGFGSKVCTAPAANLADWSCSPDPKKYDSPLVFAHGGEVYLVGRRNLNETGQYDTGDPSLPLANRSVSNQWTYWNTQKRCSLWRVDGATRTTTFLLDLPSKGDTCFASVVPLDERSYALYNYSSPVEGNDWVWVQGQQRPTNLYRMVLTFPTAR